MCRDVSLLQSSLIKNGLASPSTLHGCSSHEIREIEDAFGVHLPRTYRDFLRSIGQRAGQFMVGSSVFYPEVLNLRSYAEELISERAIAFRLRKEDFVFFVHQGYQFAFFECDQSDDPPVWYYYEGWETPQRKWPSILTFLEELATEQLKFG